VRFIGGHEDFVGIVLAKTGKIDQEA
jgi:hypothetical protein